MLIVRIWEGLGNQMFQYAYARAMMAQGKNVRLDLDRTYSDAFQANKDSLQRENVIQNFKIKIKAIDVKKYGKYEYLKRTTLRDKIIFFLGKRNLWKYNFYEAKTAGYQDAAVHLKGNHYVKGWFQSERYFMDIREILLKEFTPKKKIVLSPYLRETLNGSETVSIHIRRGDYLKLGNGLNLIYYEKAVEEIKRFYKKPVFLVFSDNLNWVKNNVKIAGEVYYVNADGQYADYEELLIMSRCKSNIIANSTFSWWAAWLNQNEEKHVIAPKKWFDTQEGIVPAEWTII